MGISENTNYSTTFFSSSLNSFTEVHVRVANNGRTERVEERQVREREKEMHTLTVFSYEQENWPFSY